MPSASVVSSSLLVVFIIYPSLFVLVCFSVCQKRSDCRHSFFPPFAASTRCSKEISPSGAQTFHAGTLRERTLREHEASQAREESFRKILPPGLPPNRKS